MALLSVYWGNYLKDFQAEIIQANLFIFKDEHKGSVVQWLGLVTQLIIEQGIEPTGPHIPYFEFLSVLA